MAVAMRVVRITAASTVAGMVADVMAAAGIIKLTRASPQASLGEDAGGPLGGNGLLHDPTRRPRGT